MSHYKYMCFSWVIVANKGDKLVTNKHMCRLLSKKQLKVTQFEPCTCSQQLQTSFGYSDPTVKWEPLSCLLSTGSGRIWSSGSPM